MKTLAQRDRDRGKTGYSKDFPPELLAHALEAQLPAGTLRIDSTNMTVDEVVTRILAWALPA